MRYANAQLPMPHPGPLVPISWQFRKTVLVEFLRFL